MHIREFSSELWLPRPLDEIFSFFSNAANLDILTPAWLHFKILTPLPIAMREGTLIDYQLRIRGIPVRWQTRINVWQPPHRFVDEQLHGPYRLWLHEHSFTSKDGETFVRDHVQYGVPLDFLLHRYFIRPDIERIFHFRKEALQKLFSTSSTPFLGH